MADPFDPFDPFPTDTLFEGDDGDDLFASLFGRNDTLIGNGGNDSLEGRDGNDSLIVG